MAGITSFTPPSGEPSEISKLNEEKLHKKQVIAKAMGVDFDGIEAKGDGGDKNPAA